MAMFMAMPPTELIKQFEELEQKAEEMMGEMTKAGAEIAFANAKSNMKKAFRDPAELISKLQITKTYKTPSDDGINTKVAVYGYIKPDKSFTRKNTYKKSTGKSYSSKGVPAPFVVIQREYGNSRGEKKVPIFRTAFNDAQIESAMLEVQNKYLPKE